MTPTALPPGAPSSQKKNKGMLLLLLQRNWLCTFSQRATAGTHTKGSLTVRSDVIQQWKTTKAARNVKYLFVDCQKYLLLNNRYQLLPFNYKWWARLGVAVFPSIWELPPQLIVQIFVRRYCTRLWPWTVQNAAESPGEWLCHRLSAAGMPLHLRRYLNLLI